MLTLPRDIIYCIAKLIYPRDILNLWSTSRKLTLLGKDESFWETYCRRWIHVSVGSGFSQWKEYFRSMYDEPITQYQPISQWIVNVIIYKNSHTTNYINIGKKHNEVILILRKGKFCYPLMKRMYFIYDEHNGLVYSRKGTPYKVSRVKRSTGNGTVMINSVELQL